MFINSQNQLYVGDMAAGDREATPEEIAAWEALRTARSKKKSVTMRQARLALLQAGLLTTVNNAVASMTGAQGEAARIEWEYSGEVQRDKALVQALAPVLGLTDAQLDALFVAAAAL